jgi:hypothetical protein
VTTAYEARHASARSAWLCNSCPLAFSIIDGRIHIYTHVLEETLDSRIGSEDTQDLHRDTHTEFVEKGESQFQKRIIRIAYKIKFLSAITLFSSWPPMQ